MNRQELKTLCELDGISGRETAVRTYLLDQLAGCPAVKQTQVDPLGNLLVWVQGKRRAVHRVLFSAHMDEVGMMVTGVTEEGYLTVSPVGGVDPAVAYGRTVRVNGRTGVIGGKAIHQCSGEEKKALPGWDKLLVDIGAEGQHQAEQAARPGDAVVFDSEWKELSGGLCKAKALDDRVGCLLLLELIRRVPEYDMMVSFVTQEEIGLRGAAAAGFTLQPDIAVVVEATTAADLAGVPGVKRVCEVGGGPVVSFMDGRTLYDGELYRRIRQIAGEASIPAQTKTMIAGGNDAGALQQAGAGARVAAISLPCRYIHSPSCVLSWRDVEETLALLTLLADTLPGEGA